MIIKLKAFIYRLSNIFGLSIYLAQKEEDAYINSQTFTSELSKSISIGCWQAQNGFTTVWTYRQSFLKGTWAKIKHAFRS